MDDINLTSHSAEFTQGLRPKILCLLLARRELDCNTKDSVAMASLHTRNHSIHYGIFTTHRCEYVSDSNYELYSSTFDMETVQWHNETFTIFQMKPCKCHDGAEWNLSKGNGEYNGTFRMESFDGKP